MMLAVMPPPEPGTYVLEFDVVHEHVRWFGCATRVTLAVEALDAAPEARQPDAVGPAMPRPRRSAMVLSHGLDGLDVRLLPHLRAGPGTFVEAGAHDGLTQSNTLLLERIRDWRGLLIEPSPSRRSAAAPTARSRRSRNARSSPPPGPARPSGCSTAA